MTINSIGDSQDRLALQLKHEPTSTVTLCIIPLTFVFVKCKQSTAVGCISVSHNDAKYNIRMYYIAVTILTQM
jgi:hypothetical protein